MMFRVYANDLSGLTNKLGFSKRTFAEWGSQVKQSFNEAESSSNRFYTSMNRFYSAGKTALFYKDNSISDFKKNSLGQIINSDNINSHIFDASAMSSIQLQGYLNGLDDAELKVKNGTWTWRQYGDTLKDNEKWLADYGAQTQGMARSEEQLRQTNGHLRQETLGYNSALKQQTFATKTATLAMRGLTAVASIVWWMFLISAISKCVSWLTGFNERLEESRKEMIEAGREAAKLTKDLDGLVEQYRKLGEDGTLDNSDRTEAYDIQKQINELIGEQADSINLVNGEYEEQLELIRRIQYDQAKKSKRKTFDAYDAAEKQLWSKANTETWYDRENDNEEVQVLSVGSGLWGTPSEQEAAKEVLDKLEKEGKVFANDHGKLGNTVREKTFDDYVARIDDINDVESALADLYVIQDELQNNYQDEITTGGKLHDFYKELKTKIDDVSGALDEYKSALKDYAFDKAVTSFYDNEYGNNKITGANINSEETMLEWFKGLQDDESLPSAVKAEMMKLAKTMYSELFKAIEGEQNKRGASVAKELLKDTVLNDADSRRLKEKAAELGITEAAMYDLMVAEIRFNNNKLNVSQKISALKEVAAWAGVAQTAIDNIDNIRASDGGKMKENWAARNGITVLKNPGKGYKDWAYRVDETGEVYDGVNEAKQALFDLEIDKATTKMKDIEIDYDPSDTGDGSSSSKSEPDIKERIDAEINEIKNNTAILKREYEEMGNAIDLLDEHDYEGKANILSQQATNIAQQITGVTENQRELASLAQAYRNLIPNVDTEQWFDEFGEATTAYIDFYNSLTKDEQENVESIFGQIQKIKKEYLEADKDITELKKSLKDNNDSIFENRYNMSKDYIEMSELEDWANGDSEVAAWQRVVDWMSTEFPEKKRELLEAMQSRDDARKSSIDDTLSEIDRYTTNITDNLQEQADAYDDIISKAEALLEIREGEFDITNKLRDAQHEIDKELRLSKVSYEWLDDETRKLIFNEEDYEKLSDKISSISSEVMSITTDFENQINNLGEDQMYLKEAITAEYKRQLDMKEKELEIAQAEVDLQKKQDKLNNILAEKNVRVFKDGRWQWTYNTEAAREATEELADVEAEIESLRLQSHQQMILNEQQANIDNLNSQKSAYEQQIEIINKAVEKFKTAIDKLEDPITDFSTSVETLKTLGIDPVMAGLTSLANKLSEVAGKTSFGGSGGSSSPGGSGVRSLLDQANKAYASGDTAKGDALIAEAAGEKTNSSNHKPNGSGIKATSSSSSGGTTTYSLKKYDNANELPTSPRLVSVNADGSETYLGKNGALHSFVSAEPILTIEQTKALQDIANDANLSYIKTNLGSKLTKTLSDINKYLVGSDKNSVPTISFGSVHFHEVENGKQAWKEVLSLAKQQTYNR